jgi:hypothetical protein
MCGGVALDGHADDFASASFAFGFDVGFVPENDGAGFFREFSVESFEELFGGLFAGEFADAIELFLFVADESIEFCFAGVELSGAISVFLLSHFEHFFFFAEAFLLFCELCETSIELAFTVAELVLAFGDFCIECFAVFEQIFFEAKLLIAAEAVCFALGLLEDFVTGFPGLSSDQSIEEKADGGADGSGERADEHFSHGLFLEI